MNDEPDPRLHDFESFLLLLARTQLENVPGNKIDANDVVQQTLVIAMEKFSQFRGDTSRELAGWLRQILANHITDLLRKRGREVDEQRLASAFEQSSIRLEKLTADDSTPSKKIARIEETLRLADALQELPDDQRRAIELRHLHGLGLKEIADKMNRSFSSVAGLLQRGLKALREILGKEPRE